MVEHVHFEYLVDNGHGEEPVEETCACATVSISQECITLDDIAFHFRRFLIAAGYEVESVSINDNFSSED